jgi:hypothetical protein
LIGQGIFHGDQKSRDLHEKSRDLSNYEIFQHKILKSQSLKKRNKTVLKIKYINSYVLQWLEKDLCRKCAKNIEKNPPKHECALGK